MIVAAWTVFGILILVAIAVVSGTVVGIYNIQIAQLPHIFLARLLGYKEHPLLHIPENVKKEVRLDFARA